MKKNITIEGMSCQHCVNHVTEALKEIGSTDVEVSLDKNLATAEIGGEITDEVIKEAISEAGYDVVKIEIA